MPLLPRRSCLYIPGANVRALTKARTLAADALILDLEDAVAREAKGEARARVCDFVREGGFGDREVVIRINDLSTPWGADDLQAAVACGARAILLPKVSAAAEIDAGAAFLAAARAQPETQLWAMIETPTGVLNCASIAAAGAGRLTALIAGCNDLAKELRLAPDPNRSGLASALSMIVTAARAHGLAAIDGVYNDIANSAGFEDECQQGRRFGFEGKTLIHPTQIDRANAVFAPSESELVRARAIVDAFKAPDARNRGVLKVNGEMVEHLHLEEARDLIAFSERLGLPL